MFVKDNKRESDFQQQTLHYPSVIWTTHLLKPIIQNSLSEQQTISLNRLIKLLVSKDLSENHVYMHTDNYTFLSQQHWAFQSRLCKIDAYCVCVSVCMPDSLLFALLAYFRNKLYSNRIDSAHPEAMPDNSIQITLPEKKTLALCSQSDTNTHTV